MERYRDKKAEAKKEKERGFPFAGYSSMAVTACAGLSQGPVSPSVTPTWG